MAQLTEHFEDHELGVEGCEGRLIDNATFLCSQILEPIRAKFGPVHVHDGYRDPGHNAAVGGKTASFHLFTDGHAAADIDALPTVSIPALFDWLRLESGLKFDKVILETNAKDVPACVHIQIDRLNPPRRQAFIGHTGAATHYEDQVSPSCPNQHASRAHAAKTTPYRKPFRNRMDFIRGGGEWDACSLFFPASRRSTPAVEPAFVLPDPSSLARTRAGRTQVIFSASQQADSQVRLLPQVFATKSRGNAFPLPSLAGLRTFHPLRTPAFPALV